MTLFMKILLIIIVVLVVVLIVLYFLGRKAKKKQEQQQAQLDASSQNVTMLIIDKKRLKLKDAGLPAMVLEQAPKLMRRAKVPVIKAKVGPKIMTLICDEKIFESIPIKKEVKAVVSGIYITSVKGMRGSLAKPEAKEGFFKRMKKKVTG